MIFKGDLAVKEENKKKNKNLWPPIFAALLVCYTAFTLLDTFVMPSDVVAVEDTTKATSSASYDDSSNALYSTDSETTVTDAGDSSSEPVITDSSYVSDNISINIITFEEYNTQIYAAEVILSDSSYLRAGLANGVFGRNVSETTSEIAEDNNAILAINGDYYGFRDKGFVMRNGYLYRSTARRGTGNEDLVIYDNGDLEIVDESTSDASALETAGAVQIFSFGPGLIENGEITVDENSEVEQSMTSNPRTAIGQIGQLHYIFLVSDGRTDESAGLTLLELAQVMSELGGTMAYILDGGCASSMWFMGEVVNNPTNGHKSGERSVSDIVYIGEQ